MDRKLYLQEYNKKYREEHKDYFKKKYDLWYSENKDSSSLRNKEWRLHNSNLQPLSCHENRSKQDKVI